MFLSMLAPPLAQKVLLSDAEKSIESFWLDFTVKDCEGYMTVEM